MCNDRKKRPLITPRSVCPKRRPYCSHPPADANRWRAAARGFTLLEVLIVVVIIGIAALAAIPMMSSAAGVQIRSASNMIAADLEYAKSMAISRAQNYAVVFDKDTETYRIEDQNGNVIPHPVKKGFDYVIDLANDGLEKVDILDVDFNSTSQVIFDCLGSPDNGGSVSLKAGSITVTVTVETVTGYIYITD